MTDAVNECWNCGAAVAEPWRDCPECGQRPRQPANAPAAEPTKSDTAPAQEKANQTPTLQFPRIDTAGTAPTTPTLHPSSPGSPGIGDTPLRNALFGGDGGRLFAAPQVNTRAPWETGQDAPPPPRPGTGRRIALGTNGGPTAPLPLAPAGPPPGPRLPPASNAGLPPGPPLPAIPPTQSGSGGSAPPPPPTGPVTPGPTATAQNARTVVGRVDGSVSTGLEARPLRGVAVLVVAVLLGVVFLLIANAKLVVGALMLGLLAVLPILVILVIVPLLIARAVGMGGAMKSVLSSSAGYAVKGAYQGGQALQGRAATVAVHRFRVRALTGEIVPCVLYGDLVGDEVRHGDYVRLSGARSRDGHLMLTSAEILQGPTGPTVSTVRTRRGLGHHVAIWADRVGLIAGVVIFALTAVGFIVLLVNR